METRHRITAGVLALAVTLLSQVVGPVAPAHAMCHIPFLDCTQNVPAVVIGSPSGQVGSFPVTIYAKTTWNGTCHLLTSSDMPDGMYPQIWLAVDGDFCDIGTIRLLSNDSGGGDMHCRNENADESGYPCVFWPYIEGGGNPVTFHPRFGGFGYFSLQLELPCHQPPPIGPGLCPGYTTIGNICVEARSTDFDADGDTDQGEKITLGQNLLLAQQSRDIRYDLNVDGVVDAADYRILAGEMVTEIQQGHPQLYTCASNTCVYPDPCNPVAINGTFVADTSKPGTTVLSLSGSASSVTLSWTSPGDDTCNGQQIGVAKEFDLRGSANPITAANFDSATALAGVPIPGLPGTAHQLTVNACSSDLKYFAIKTKDWAGNVSAMSNVVAARPLAVTDLGSTVYCTTIDLSWTVPGSGCTPGTATTYDLRRSRSNITEANFAAATQTFSGNLTSPGSGMSQTFYAGACSGRWYFAMKVSDAGGNTSDLSDVAQGGTPCRFCDDGLALKPVADVPLGLAVPSPNPVAGAVVFRYSIPSARTAEPFELALFDASGRRVRTLQQGGARAGDNAIEWNLTADGGDRVAAGIYFLRLRLGSDQRSQSVMVLR